MKINRKQATWFAVGHFGFDIYWFYYKIVHEQESSLKIPNFPFDRETRNFIVRQATQKISEKNRWEDETWKPGENPYRQWESLKGPG